MSLDACLGRCLLVLASVHVHGYVGPQAVLVFDGLCHDDEHGVYCVGNGAVSVTIVCASSVLHDVLVIVKNYGASVVPPDKVNLSELIVIGSGHYQDVGSYSHQYVVTCLGAVTRVALTTVIHQIVQQRRTNVQVLKPFMLDHLVSCSRVPLCHAVVLFGLHTGGVVYAVGLCLACAHLFASGVWIGLVVGYGLARNGNERVRVFVGQPYGGDLLYQYHDVDLVFGMSDMVGPFTQGCAALHVKVAPAGYAGWLIEVTKLEGVTLLFFSIGLGCGLSVSNGKVDFSN